MNKRLEAYCSWSVFTAFRLQLRMVNNKQFIEHKEKFYLLTFWGQFRPLCAEIFVKLMLERRGLKIEGFPKHFTLLTPRWPLDPATSCSMVLRATSKVDLCPYCA